MKSKLFQEPLPSQPLSKCSFSQSEKSSAKAAYRTDSVPGYGDPGGGEDAAPHKPQPSLPENREVLETKRSHQHYGPGGTSNSSQAAADTHPQGNRSPTAAGDHYREPQLASPPHPDTDSALEAAVNSILEC